MRASRIQLLTQVRQGIEQILLPELSSSSARTFVDLTTRILNGLIAEETALGWLQTEQAAAEDAALAEAEAGLDALGHEAQALIGDAAKLGESRTPFTPLEMALTRLMATCRADAPEAVKTRARDCFRKLVRAERVFRQGLDPEVAWGRDSLYGGGRLNREENPDDAVKPADVPRIAADTLEAYLRRRPGWEDAAVERLNLLPGGFAKETLLFTVRRGTLIEDLVIRRDLPRGANGASIVTEFPLLRATFAAGLRVPEPLWLETDASAFATPFMVLRKLPGGNDISAWKDDPAKTDRCLRTLAEQMAMLHQMAPVPELAAGRETWTTPQWIALEVEKFYTLYLQRRAAPNPLLTASYAWLRANIPDSGISPRIVHGDLGFHNMLTTADGAVSAVLDWEYTRLGDPQEDLNYVRPFVEMTGPWSRFIDYYHGFGGPRFREEDRLFWDAWTGIRNGSGCVGALEAFSSGDYANPDAALKLAVAGLNFGPRHLLYSLERIVEADQYPADVAASS